MGMRGMGEGQMSKSGRRGLCVCVYVCVYM